MACSLIIPEQPVKYEDRRYSTRHRVKTLAYVDLGLDNGGMLINVSEGGLSFQGIHPLELGQRLLIGLKPPGSDQSFKATGEVAWLCDSRKGGGLRFIELPKNTKDLIKEWNAAMALDDIVEQPTSLTSRIDTEKNHPRAILRSVVQRNRPSASMNNSLADVIRDSSLSRDVVIAAINASRSDTTAVHSTDSTRTRNFPYRTPMTESVRTKLPTAPLRTPYREQTGKVSSTVPGDPRLGLKVERTGKDWHVCWNRKSDFLARAVSGSLSITDGSFRKELEMDVSELRSGSIIYTPASDDVILRLQVLTKNFEQPVSETVRIIACKVP